MMMIIAGLERASKGEVHVGGTRFTGLDEDSLARFRRDSVGIVFQDFHLVPTMTALENVAIPLEFAGRADAFERAAARSEEHTSELQSLMRISYAVFCLKNKTNKTTTVTDDNLR